MTDKITIKNNFPCFYEGDLQNFERNMENLLFVLKKISVMPPEKRPSSLETTSEYLGRNISVSCRRYVKMIHAYEMYSGHEDSAINPREFIFDDGKLKEIVKREL